jgi:hypothetical protein
VAPGAGRKSATVSVIVSTIERTRECQPGGNRLWMPRQHGVWAMLAVPLLLGIAVTRPTGWDLVLAAAAVAGYLASATAQALARTRSRERYAASLVAYGVVAGILGIALAVAQPVVLLTLLVLVPAGAVTLLAARLGRARGVVAGLAQVAQALVLLPAAASLAGPIDSTAVARATFLAAIYLIGTMLAVRSVIREQGNAAFAALSVGFHVTATVVAVLLLPAPYVPLLVVLAIRAAALPIAQVRLRGTARPLRPTQVGIGEMVFATLVVAIAFIAPMR